MLSKIGVAMADHIIVAGNETLSMASCGLIIREQQYGRIVSRVADSAGETLIRAKLVRKRKEMETNA